MRQLLLIAALASSLAACTKKNEGAGSVTLTFPTSAQTSNKVGTMSVTFANVCYLANITGGKYERGNSSCGIGLSNMHSAFVRPGDSVTLEVARGSTYSLQIFAYERNNSTDPCPSISTALSYSNMGRLYEVAKKSFAVNEAEVTVNVTVADPGQSVVAQYSIPSTCQATNLPSPPVLTSPSGKRLVLAIAPMDGMRLTTTGPSGMKLTIVKDGSQ